MNLNQLKAHAKDNVKKPKVADPEGLCKAAELSLCGWRYHQHLHLNKVRKSSASTKHPLTVAIPPGLSY